MISREKRIERAQMRILFRCPFFAPGLARLPVIFEAGAGDNTAHTDGTCIKMDPDFVDKLTNDQLVTLLCHEALHPMLGHLWRAPSAAKVDQESWGIWNQATDHAVNLMLKEFSALTMGRRLADPFPFPDPQDAYCADPKFAGMAEEQIFNILNNRPKKPRGKGPGNAPGTMPSFGQFSQPGKAADPTKQNHLQNDWKNTLIQAAEMAKGRGELPAGMQRLVDELVNPRVPWVEILRSWLREQCEDDFDYMKPNLTMEESGFLMPSLHAEKMGSVVFCIDTSGSVNHELLAQFKSEEQSALDDLNPSKLIEICCDSEIQSERVYFAGDRISPQAPGGGGTSFEPALARCVEMEPQPKCIVYLTDGDGSFGKDPGIPVVWVMYGGCNKAPFGDVVTV